MKAVAYFRVSTSGQERSGLGLEAQRDAVTRLARIRSISVLAEFTEVESGKRNDRPQLMAAVQQAKATGAALVIAKLDRLSRNAAFLLTLRDSGVRFMAADIPDANDLTIGVLAVIAQAEREMISRRTAEALSAVKRRILAEGHHQARSGAFISRLGNPNGSSALLRAAKGNGSAVEAVRRSAAVRASELQPILEAVAGNGPISLSAVAKALNHQGILTARNRKWHPSTVSALMKRLQRKPDPQVR